MLPTGDNEIEASKPGWDHGNSTIPPVVDCGPIIPPFASLNVTETPE